MKMGIAARLIGSFSIIIVIMGIIAASGLIGLSGMNDRLNTVADSTAEKIRIGARINRNLVEINRAEKNIILANSVEKMKEFRKEIQGLEADMLDRRERLRKLLD